MTDFTKDELEDLYYSVRVMHKIGYDLPSYQSAYGLMTKIRKIIDNYCENNEITEE